MKDALCHTVNLTLAVQMDAEKPGEMDDEFCHAHSEYLTLCFFDDRLDLASSNLQQGSLLLVDPEIRQFPGVLICLDLDLLGLLVHRQFACWQCRSLRVFSVGRKE